MLLTVSTTANPATDLGFLLAKNPARVQVFDLTYGKAHVFYPEATEALCTVALLLDIDPIALVRGREGVSGGGALDAYVNDRPYASCYLMAQAIKKVFASALKGQCKERAELAQTAIPLTCTIHALPCWRGEELIRRLFEPLGYEVTCKGIELDSEFPGWGPSPFHEVSISACTCLSTLLTHLMVLIPVLDNDRNQQSHDSDVELLVRRGDGWLNDHPARDLIARRYLHFKKGSVNAALDQLAANAADAANDDAGEDETESTDESASNTGNESMQAAPGIRVNLHQQRHEAVLAALVDSGAASVIDLGCGSGKFLDGVLPLAQFERILGLEASQRSLSWARTHLQARRNQDRLKLVQGSVTFRDPVMRGFDAAVSVEVIEHLDPERLDSFADTVFAFARPRTVIITTPNIEYNVLFPSMSPGQLRHHDHRFEWTRAEFQAWCNTQAETYGYAVAYSSVGEEDPVHGAPSQMAVFTRIAESAENEPLNETPSDNDSLPNLGLMLRGGYITTSLSARTVKIPCENALGAFEQVAAHVVDPRWLVYLPPTMSPSGTSRLPGMLEHPAEAINHYRRHGVTKVVCEEKHMGSRAVLVVLRDPGVARSRFGFSQDSGGVCYTRTGRPFFPNSGIQADFIDRVRLSLDGANFWNDFNTDWVVLDCELMPWSAKAQGLLRKQYAPMGAAANLALPAVISTLEACQRNRGQDVSPLTALMQERLICAGLFQESYRRYCWDINSLDDYRLAPFHIMATEGAVHTDKNHVWHMENLARVASASDGMIIATPYKVVDMNDDASVRDATQWWESLTADGGEGMVVKPYDFVTRDEHGVLQPAVKCRGREYLRIIYGPDYTMPHHLERMRKRGLHGKQSLALKEFALGIEALERFVRKEPVARVHECAFGVLALESEAIDPRL